MEFEYEKLNEVEISDEIRGMQIDCLQIKVAQDGEYKRIAQLNRN